MNFGNKLKMKRLELGYTQKELGEKIGVGRTTISEYESGNIVPKQDKLIRLSNILNVSIDYLTGQSDFEHSLNEDIFHTEFIINHWIISLISWLDDDSYTPILFGEELNNEQIKFVKVQLNHLIENLRLISKIK